MVRKEEKSITEILRIEKVKRKPNKNKFKLLDYDRGRIKYPKTTGASSNLKKLLASRKSMGYEVRLFYNSVLKRWEGYVSKRKKKS